MLLEAAGGCDMDATDRDDRSAVSRACEAGHMDVAKLLLEKGASHEQSDHYITDERCPLVAASKAGNMPLVSGTGSK